MGSDHVQPVYERDEYNRRIRDDRSVPSVKTAERFDRWRGALLAPDVVLTYWEHRSGLPCSGWVKSQGWWFVCGRCHPDAVDEGTGESRNSSHSGSARPKLADDHVSSVEYRIGIEHGEIIEVFCSCGWRSEIHEMCPTLEQLVEAWTTHRAKPNKEGEDAG